MPFLHIRISGPEDDALASRVASTASELTARHLGKDPSLTAVAVAFVPSPHWFVAGRGVRDDARTYHWAVFVTDETNTKAEKAAYLEAVHRSMDSLLGGTVPEHSYAHVVDARASAYGFGGRTQEWRFQHPA